MAKLLINKGYGDLNITRDKCCSEIIGRIRAVIDDLNNSCIVYESLDEMLKLLSSYGEIHYIFESGFYSIMDRSEDLNQLELLQWITEDIDTLCDRYGYANTTDEVKLLYELLYFVSRSIWITDENKYDWLNIIDDQY